MASIRERLVLQMSTEARAMASHALGAGRTVPGPVLEAVARGSGAGAAQIESMRELTRAHGALVKLIAPATPELAIMMESGAGDRKFLGSAPAVRSFIWAAVLSLAAFIGLFLLSSSTGMNQADILRASGLPLLVHELFFLSAAAVGASFANLFQIDQEITGQTFVPRYLSSYWVRFVLGLVAGLLLATLFNIRSLVPQNTAEIEQLHLGAAGLALVGGFSSSVVQRIVQRMIEALDTIVRGSGEREIAAREQASKLKLEQSLAVERAHRTLLLTDIQRRIASGESVEPILRQIDELTRRISSSEGKETLPVALPQADPESVAEAALVVRAVVESEDGTPLPDMPCEIHRDGRLVATARTDARGEIAQPVIQGGDYEIVVLGREQAAGAPLSPAASSGAPHGDIAAQRGRAAWHSARRELARGAERHGPGKTWESDGPNRGPVVDDYLRAFDSLVRGKNGPPWCGMFLGYNYLEAGFKTAGQIPASMTPDGRPMPRKTIFLSAVRMLAFLKGARRPCVELPPSGRGPATRAACAAWLDENLRAFAPRPGDILLCHTAAGDYKHVAMVAGYDPVTHVLTTYEGNYGQRASAWRWDLADPSETGFYRINLIGRLSPEDFEDRCDVPPDGPSPEPAVERGAAAIAV